VKSNTTNRIRIDERPVEQVVATQTKMINKFIFDHFVAGKVWWLVAYAFGNFIRNLFFEFHPLLL